MLSCFNCGKTIHVIIYDTVKNTLLGVKELSQPRIVLLSITGDGKTLVEASDFSVRISDFDKWIRNEEDSVKTEWNFPTDNDQGIIVSLGQDLSKDGKKVALCGYDHKVSVYDTFTGDLLYEYTGKNSRYELRFPIFSPEGDYLALSGNNSTLYIFDLKAKTANLIPMPKLDVIPLAWTADGTELLLSVKKKLILYNIAENKTVKEFTFGKETVEAAVIDKKKTALILVLSSKDGLRQCIFDIVSGKELYTKLNWANGNLFTDDGQYVYLGGIHGVTVFNRQTNTAKLLFGGHLAGIRGVRFLSDKERTLISFESKEPRIIEYESGIETGRLPLFTYYNQIARLSPDKKILYTDLGPAGAGCYFYDMAKMSLIKKIPNYFNSKCNGMIAPDFSCVIAGKYDGPIGLYNVPGGKKVFDLQATEDSCIESAAFTSDSSKVAIIDRNSVFQLFDTKTGELLKTYFCGNESLFSPSLGFIGGNEFWYLQKGDSIEIYEISTGQLKMTIPLNNRCIADLFFSSSEPVFLIHFKGKSIDLVNWETGKTLQSDDIQQNGISCFMPNWSENRIYYGFHNGDVKFLDITTCQWDNAIKTNGPVYNLDCSVDYHLLSVQHEMAVEIFDTVNYTKIANIPLHENPYNKLCPALTFSSDWKFAVEIFNCKLYVTKITEE